jgi:hypothetical protein
MNPNIEIIGTVSAYHAKRRAGEALPGLLRAQDVSHFHDVMQRVRNLDEANKKKAEFEAQQKAAAAVHGTPGAPPPEPRRTTAS